MPKQNPWPDLNIEHTWLLYKQKHCEPLLTTEYAIFPYD
jgi:hypothetical protein